ncbi:uncharacterized protein BDV14DRAFT_208029 [Aspergillus stella-maris]|uniref:uncharacterized protein n=1 Tax=Aspergillus stella-maris TaxID=1810926 RepID=UPI003CCD10A1
MYRRNGQATSCEPCRLSKVRCDHQKPVCSRCRDRAVAGQCFYHPAPMTRKISEFRPPSSTKPRKPEQASLTSDSPSGYLGFFSTLSLRPALHPDALSSHLASVSEEIQSMTLEYYNGTHFSVIPRPLIVGPVTGFLRGLKKDDSKGNLRRSMPAMDSNTSKEDFLSSFTGVNVRMEFIGLMFVLAGVACFYTDTRPTFDDMTFGMEMYAAARISLQICDSYNQVNELTTWARYINLHLSSVLLGNANEAVYQVFNESVTELFVMGFHRLTTSPPNVPFFILESRRRIFAAAVSRDKAAATLFGRPPRIDSRFCDMALPSDLDDEEVLLDNEQLRKIFDQLDENGWKCTTGKNRGIRQSSLIRLRYQHGLLQEKVLRLSQGNRTGSFSTELRDLYQEYRDFFDKIPKQYRYHGGVWADSSPHLCVALLVVHLIYLYSGFLLERMLLEDSQISSSALLDTSQKLLSGVLDFIQQQNSHPELRERYTWMFLYYGLPGAGTLATELHQSVQKGERPAISTSVSKVVRDLSVLLAYFEHKRFPDRPDFQICIQISKVIGAILDDTLNRGIPAPQPTSTSDQDGQGNQSSLITVGAEQKVSLEAIPSLPGTLTSYDFLNWFDELIWDFPAGNLDLENMGPS